MSTTKRKQGPVGIVKRAAKPPTKKVIKSTAARAAAKKVAVHAKRKKPAEKDVAIRILSAPKGKRTLTHKQIKEAVESVFAERQRAYG